MEQPGWLEHVASVRAEHAVGVPAQLVAPVDQEHPYSAEHAAAVAFEAHGFTDPEQVVVQEQPYWVAHALCVDSELQGVIVPVHAPAVQVQLYWLEQADDVVSDEQPVSVPVQGVFQVHPALAQRLDEEYEEHAVGVPLHTYSPRLEL
jgi:hypothetical protein